MEAMTISIAIILSLISTITAAPTAKLQNFPSNMVLGDIDLDTGSGYSDMDDKILNRRHIPLENCKAIQESGLNTTGLYVIRPKHNSGEFTVFCDMTLLGGGWTVIQRRIDDSLNFNRKYRSYQNGFGDFFENFWLGLEKMHQLTHGIENMELHVGLESFNGDNAFARFSNFFIENEDAGYTLRIGECDPASTAGDSLASHNGMRFSTKDNDRDSLRTVNCAEVTKGGWWYKNCHDSNLNGLYYKNGKLASHIPDGIIWQHWLGDSASLKTVVLAIRPKNTLKTMAQFFKLGFATLLFFIGFTSSLPLHKLEKRSSATFLGDLTSGTNSGILNDDQDFPSYSCKELYDAGYLLSGRYKIIPGDREFTVFCDMNLQGGGWTVIQRRISDSVDFDRDWRDYQLGFGDFDGNFWLGLEQIKEITDYETNELYLGFESQTTTFNKATYASITLKDEANFYEIDLGSYTGVVGDAGDSFGVHDAFKFSTHDKDNDGIGTDCAGTYNSGWWYGTNCHEAHLNGIYYNDAATQPNGHGIIWEEWQGISTPLKTVVIAVRPA
ncbi:uncharacterized protein LOC135341231 [Halichondria panicea]|uniref:uncharacterized protein LOC135341231 n=1 Tax=Halichondria panicea TaxID=6063 RepID=UPI00312B4421